ncbi:HPr family phosphocarrier protein [Oceanibacterium hippocampi]|uniref:Phosphocarrier protein NPr n=1 Tax=Oceanibacterium hippocampi TaxID=745714 RepID=A0A1Y5RP76_9PROT|nr:HPr family phosphocarrier protein [Oceanibacterium hippocampi]SLN22130.1 Phosphocarrier protein NPr [Oceanibacterium hippocampi]
MADGSPDKSGETLVRHAVIDNQRGLHARAAAKFVKCLNEFEADVTVVKDGQQVSGFSIMGLMMLAAAKGTALEIRARGPQAAEAIDALCRLIADRFHED